MNYLYLLGDLANAAPRIAVWVVALILSSAMLKNGGGKTERLLVIGSGVMLLSTLVGLPITTVTNYGASHGRSALDAGLALTVVVWSANLIALPGIVCLFWGIWRKFNDRIAATNENSTQRRG